MIDDNGGRSVIEALGCLTKVFFLFCAGRFVTIKYHTRIVSSSGTGLALLPDMPDQATRNPTQSKLGWLITGLSLAALLGIALLKGHVDSGDELDINP